MGYTLKQPKPLYPDWSTVSGIVLSVYEKSLIYSVPAGYFRKKVRIPLSVLARPAQVDDMDIQVKGWFAAKEGLDKAILPSHFSYKGK